MSEISAQNTELPEIDRRNLQILKDLFNKVDRKIVLVGGAAKHGGQRKDLDVVVLMPELGECSSVSESERRLNIFMSELSRIVEDSNEYLKIGQITNPHCNDNGIEKFADHQGSVVVLPQKGTQIELLPRAKITKHG